MDYSIDPHNAFDISALNVFFNVLRYDTFWAGTQTNYLFQFIK